MFLQRRARKPKEWEDPASRRVGRIRDEAARRPRGSADDVPTVVAETNSRINTIKVFTYLVPLLPICQPTDWKGGTGSEYNFRCKYQNPMGTLCDDHKKLADMIDKF